MNVSQQLDAISLPAGLRTKMQNHLSHQARAEDLHALKLALARAKGFVEGVDAAHALTPATIEALFIAVEDAAAARHRELNA
ncbi:hypothetical protein [Pseudomonas sp. RGB]|uniref:hypothetical protein n=1 Tax=unclassified Pseudomonas TaxID=196821 RepID=UPI001192CC72|nr:hypothetical protein [Pseudomonas sp. RGB]TVT89436.1 hypothetical protein FPT15_19715 [Pseudomonas sp. RGB]